MSTPASNAVTSANDIVQLDRLEHQFGESLLRLGLRRLSRDYLTLVAIVVLVVLSLLSLFAPIISTEVLNVDYRKTNSDPNFTFLETGSDGHLLGTDNLGRDHLSRLLYAGRVSLGIGFMAAIVSLLIGVTLGVITGYYQGSKFGVIDDFMMWFITTLNSVPQLFLLLIIAAVLSPTVWSLILILSFISWSEIMRLVRGETLAQREREYILAARALGASATRIMFIHILPNVFSILIITLMINIGGLILTESALSYLGLGVQEPVPSWGNMLTKAQTFFAKGFHLVVAPGSLIVVTVLCLYLVGDGLRDAFDPRATKNK